MLVSWCSKTARKTFPMRFFLYLTSEAGPPELGGEKLLLESPEVDWKDYILFQSPIRRDPGYHSFSFKTKANCGNRRTRSQSAS